MTIASKKTIFSSNHQFLCWSPESPLEVPDVRTFRGPSGDAYGTSHVGWDVSVESIDCILLSSLELKAILLISSVKTLCLSLLNLCCIFNIDLSFFINSL